MEANESVDARVRRRLRELRTEQGLTLAQVGERANIDLSTLSRLESGKRRLARDIGDLAALRFERHMLARLLRRLGRDRRWHLRLAVTPDHACHRKRLWPRGIPIAGQGRGDLGHRMRRALAACPPGPAVLIGTDIPALGPGHIAEAFRLLGHYEIVFGPAVDGGFWLVKEYFNMSVTDTMKSWSITETLISVIALLLVLGLSVVL